MLARRSPEIALVLAIPLVWACASKGWVKDQIAASQKITTAYTDSSVRGAVGQEAAARSAADDADRAQMAAMQAELDSLRTQFHTAVSMVGTTIRFAMPITFAFDDATVSEADQPALDRFAMVVSKFYPGSVVTVEGFTDPAGSNGYNLALSKRRAESVAQYLTTKGLDTDHVRTVGYGKARLIHPDAQRDDPGAEQNRRAVFVVETAEAGASSASSDAEQ